MYTSAGSPEENTSPGCDRSLERETDKERKYACDLPATSASAITHSNRAEKRMTDKFCFQKEKIKNKRNPYDRFQKYRLACLGPPKTVRHPPADRCARCTLKTGRTPDKSKKNPNVTCARATVLENCAIVTNIQHDLIVYSIRSN